MRNTTLPALTLTLFRIKILNYASPLPSPVQMWGRIQFCKRITDNDRQEQVNPTTSVALSIEAVLCIAGLEGRKEAGGYRRDDRNG